MKKKNLLVIALLAIFTLSVVSCGGKDSKKTEDAEKTEKTESAEKKETAEAESNVKLDKTGNATLDEALDGMSVIFAKMEKAESVEELQKLGEELEQYMDEFEYKHGEALEALDEDSPEVQKFKKTFGAFEEKMKAKAEKMMNDADDLYKEGMDEYEDAYEDVEELYEEGMEEYEELEDAVEETKEALEELEKYKDALEELGY